MLPSPPVRKIEPPLDELDNPDEILTSPPSPFVLPFPPLMSTEPPLPPLPLPAAINTFPPKLVKGLELSPLRKVIEPPVSNVAEAEPAKT